MIENSTQVWTVIILLGLGSFGLRFLFLGLVGDRQMPEWLLRHLRYTAVAIIPAMVAPLVVWPEATGGQPEPTRLAVAAITFAMAVWTKNVLLALSVGAALMFGLSVMDA